MNHTTHQRKALFAGIVGATALMLGAPVNAQQEKNITSLGIEEMVVTAQKREENMQAVPISISTLSAMDIERRGVQNPRDLLAAMPNVGGFEPPGGKGSMSVAMRGVSAGSPSNLSIDTSTAMYIDGVLIGKMVGAATDVAELERVEVLRGPQGTLYGRNATGGAINFITKKPSGEFGGRITATAGNESLWGIRAMVDTPTLGTEGEGLGTLKATAAAQTRKRDGFQKNTTPVQKDFDNLDRQAYRVALRWEPTDTITADYAYTRTKLDETNSMQNVVGLTPLAYDPYTQTATSRVTALNGYLQAGQAAGVGLGPLAGAAADPTFTRWLDSTRAMRDRLSNLGSTGKRPDRGASDSRATTENDVKGHSLTLAWQVDDLGVLGDVEFKSITAERKLTARNIGDLDGVDNTIAPGGAGALNDSALGALYQFYAGQTGAAPGTAAFIRMGTAKLWSLIDQNGGGGFVQDAAFEYKQVSQELQMVGSTERLQYAVGLYYFEDDGSFDNYRLAAVPVGGVLSTNYDNDTTAKALYSQFTYTPPILEDRLAVTVGYRHTSEKKGVRFRYMDDGDSRGQGLFSGPGGSVNLGYTGALSPTPVYGERYHSNFSNNSGAFTLAYQLSDNTNVFLRWASGYRSGGYNGEVYSSKPFDEETIKQWELGMKSDLIPGTLRVNASVFKFTVEDMQVSQIQAVNNKLTSFLVNAGEADRWGTELEVQWSVTDNLLLSASWAHMSGDFEKYPELCGTGVYAQGGSEEICLNQKNLAERPQSPDNQVSLVADWVFASTDWADFMAHLEVFWQEKNYAAAVWNAGYNVPGKGQYPYIYDQVTLKQRTLVNLRLGMENVEFSNGTSLRASLWARNLFDKEYNIYGMNFGSLGPILAQYGEPRTYGLDITWDF